jgi:hypothetical protein
MYPPTTGNPETQLIDRQCKFTIMISRSVSTANSRNYQAGR